MSTKDETLVRACLKGDRSAFGTLLDRYEKTVYNLALRMVHHREDARDITQNVFSKVLEHLPQFDFRHRLYSWIYRIAINECLDVIHRRGRPIPAEASGPSVDPSPEELLESNENSRAVRKALMILRPDHRSVIVLRHYLHHSYREIAEILQIPEKTVRSRLFTARRALGDALAAAGVSRERTTR